MIFYMNDFIISLTSLNNEFMFYFFRLAANDRGYGLGGSAGVFAVAQGQSECGRKTCKKHISRPKHIGVC